MYDLVSDIINHSYESSYGGEQQYIYYICAALIVVFSVWVLDLIKCVINSAAGKR